MTKKEKTSRESQRGAALVLIIVALAALMLMAGLALDGGHMMLSKTRLQDTVDAAALAAAKTLDETSSTTLATTEALLAFGSNASAAGNQELGSSYAAGNGSLTVTVQYSATLPPFVAGSPVGPYVRVSATGFTLPTWLVQLAGINQFNITATAVAGPSPAISSACNISPMMVCGNAAVGAAGLWGYTLNAPTVLKSSAPGSAQVGPGNFQLIQLGGTGANIVRQNLAGSFASCATTGNSVQTQTGNVTGPTAQGLNTRFGQYSGGGMTEAQYPPDVIVTSPTPALTVDSSGNILEGSTAITSSNINLIFNYQTYMSEIGTPADYNYQPIDSGGPGAFQRRILEVPVGDCTGTSNGTTTVPVLGFMCFFLLQPVTQQGTTDYALGQFVGNCDVNGTPGPNPGTGPGPYVIQLYHDPSSGDS
jgi:Flp pilus assembly protein TadG